MYEVEKVDTHQPSIKDTYLEEAGTSHQIINYYVNSPGYLTGPLGGTCHFGFTPLGQPFELYSALYSMETLLGQKLSLPPGSLVLDAGCGYGRVATTMADRFGLNIIGIDLTRVRLKEALLYTQAKKVSSKVHLLEGNYCALPLKDSTVSGVFTMETLCHADPLETALDEFRRVLKPGGRLVLFEYSVPDRASLDPLRRRITDNMVKRIGMASIGRFIHGSFPSLLEKAGFEDITVDEISHNVYPTWRWLFFRAIQESLPKILHGQLRKDTNLLASFLIYPYRHNLGYNVVTANKPDSSYREIEKRIS